MATVATLAITPSTTAITADHECVNTIHPGMYRLNLLASATGRLTSPNTASNYNKTHSIEHGAGSLFLNTLPGLHTHYNVNARGYISYYRLLLMHQLDAMEASN